MATSESLCLMESSISLSAYSSIKSRSRLKRTRAAELNPTPSRLPRAVTPGRAVATETLLPSLTAREWSRLAGEGARGSSRRSTRRT